MALKFDYQVMTTRNIGFVSEAEQATLRAGRVFVCGTGGMGGAALQALVRAGVTKFEIADFDSFEVSNLNRQVFCTLDTLGSPKLESTRDALLKINPECEILIHGKSWPEDLDSILSRCKIVINGMDDIRAGITLYRKAREHGATVIDAYTSPLPSVTVVRPEDPRPEERLRCPTLGKTNSQITEDDLNGYKMKEIEYVMTHSSSAKHLHLEIAAEMVAGKRSRMSFAPMVITTGNLMAYEAIHLILGTQCRADYRGYFFNPVSARTEQARNPLLAVLMGWLVRRFLRKMVEAV